MAHQDSRIRILILGSSAVGKTCILKRFLFNSFTDKYKPTVEDLYTREYDFGTTTLKVDIVDTCGDFQFPAMRRLLMMTSHAYLFVYSTNSVESFNSLKRYFEEFKENREDFQTMPIVVVGNKLDLGPEAKQVGLEDVSEWLYCEQPRLKVKLMECSAKDNYNIKEIFQQFLILSRRVLTEPRDESALKRRSSAYVSTNSSRRSTSSSNSYTSPNSLSVEEPHFSQEGSSQGTQQTKPRSRSLIRRSSKKAKQQLQDTTQGGVNDCTQM